jgi:uncharacterized membrane protein YedE/YeeE
MEAVGFTPLSGTVGGLLIGIAASLLLLANGRIAGISGILGSALRPLCPDRAWRVLFLIGLPLGALIASALTGRLAPPEMAAPAPILALAGLLVGFGTQLGSGCTSGHGVCGLARRSRRSLAGTLVFMLTGAATVFAVRHLLTGS